MDIVPYINIAPTPPGGRSENCRVSFSDRIRGMCSDKLSDDLLHGPDTARTDPRADAAADAVFIISHVFKRTVFQLLASDGPLGAGLQTHAAVAAGSTGETTVGLQLDHILDLEMTAFERTVVFLAKTASGESFPASAWEQVRHY